MQDLFKVNENQDKAKNTEHDIVPVLCAAHIDKIYSYGLPAGMAAKAGSWVQVPLGKSRTVPGVVWDKPVEAPDLKKLKTVTFLALLPPMTHEMMRFIEQVAAYNMAPLGAVLKMVLSQPDALENKPQTVFYKKTKISISDIKQGITPKRKSILLNIDPAQLYTHSMLAAHAKTSTSTIQAMAKAGLLEKIVRDLDPPCISPDANASHVTLSQAQNDASNKIINYIKESKHRVVLLDGVTGSGKTETYFEGIAQALEEEGQVLILLPEIALSDAFALRFKQRFGCAPALWHSGITKAQKRDIWRGVLEGKTKVVAGARSALFLPFQNLKLIVVDEAHDGSYKQEDNTYYHARDMAVLRSWHHKIPCLLVSATPSLETMVNVWQGRFSHLVLPERHGGASMPDIRLIDLRESKPESQRFLSPTLVGALVDSFRDGAQSLLFLNRRGFAPLTLCRTCGHRIQCPRCTAWLVEHKASHSLDCHHCGYRMRYPDICPSCSDKDSLAACGPGVERIYEEVKELIPEARCLILASDANHPDLRQTLKEIADHKYDIIIGTQIIAKGHHFPKLKTVGVVDADLGLQGGDLRAAERSFQLLTQVAGRAGRESEHGKGLVYLQSWAPETPVMQALARGERDAFLAAEAKAREDLNLPPYGRLAAIIVSGRDEKQVDAVAALLGKTAPQGEGITSYGPAPAPMAKLRGRHRRRLLIHADKKLNIQKTIQHWLSQLKYPSTVEVRIDIDPQSFL